MIEKTVLCTICPIGCAIDVEGEGNTITSIEGHTCKRGEEYARNEFISPVRILTSTVMLKGASVSLVPVRSSKPVPKELLFDCMDIIRKASVKTPVNIYDVIIPDILETGIDIVATASAE